jgi:DNA-binding MarR family transcriptional regulator
VSGKVVGWAFEQGRERDLSPIQRYVLIAYGDNASEAGKCWPDKPEIVDKTGLSRATVFRAIKVLERENLLTFAEDEKGRECVFLSVPWSSHCETAESHPETAESHSEIRSNKGTVKEPSEKQRTVNRKVVSESELTLAAAVVFAFNNSAGTELSVGAHLTPIVGRIREKPDYTEEHHRKIIEAVFAGDHWWTGAPTPKIIYGNPAIFEQSIELARQAAKRASSSDIVNEEFHRIRREQGAE